MHPLIRIHVGIMGLTPNGREKKKKKTINYENKKTKKIT